MRRKNTTSLTMKRYISEALVILMKNNKYNEITIQNITTKAGVNRSTYYRHFDSKDEIIKFYYLQIIDEHIKIIPSKDISFSDYLIQMFTHYYTYKEELLTLHQAGKSYFILDIFNSIFVQKYNTNNVKDVFYVYYHTGGIYNHFVLWFSNKMKFTPKQMTDYALRILPTDFTPVLIKNSQ
ncbi:MAG: TetR/AcrR family transcriptional regulator [Coprobacillaceae bacterium]